MNPKHLPTLLLLGVLVGGCSKTESNDPIIFQNPSNFPAPSYNLNKNVITTAGFQLGKALFNDPILSRDNSISCAECHGQAYAFTHHGHDLSHGIENRKGTRNSLPLQNLAWQKEFFWDGGVGDLDFVPLAPIENTLEMDEQIGKVLEKLRKTQYYPAQFKKAYGSSDITTQGFLKALSQYMLSLVSANAKYDKYVRKELTLTADELAGLSLFQAKCASCHAGMLFTDQSYRNNGLVIQDGGSDIGRGRITEKKEDYYKFKVPSLRNVEVTKPYMHDGRFYTLEAVLDHYATGVQQTPNLDPLLQQNVSLGIPLTATEKSQLVAFLKTLTDTQFLQDKRF